jgi:hypothetical protein
MKQALMRITMESRADSSSPRATGSTFSAMLPVVKESKQLGISKQSVLDRLKVGMTCGAIMFLCLCETLLFCWEVVRALSVGVCSG